MVGRERTSGPRCPIDKENPMIAQGLQPYSNTIADPPVYFLGLPTILRATGERTDGAFGLVENLMPPGFASPYHTHRLEDESFYVLEGRIAFICGGKWTSAEAGTFVFGPRNIPHGFKVLGDTPARMLLLCTPGGFDGFVLEMSEPAPAPPDMAKLMAVAAKYSVDILGPLPEQPDVPASPASV
jgi:quercetin dioxygenase-like cupin family protein